MLSTGLHGAGIHSVAAGHEFIMALAFGSTTVQYHVHHIAQRHQWLTNYCNVAGVHSVAAAL